MAGGAFSVRRVRLVKSRERVIVDGKVYNVYPDRG